MASNTCCGCSVSAPLSKIEFMSPEGQELTLYSRIAGSDRTHEHGHTGRDEIKRGDLQDATVLVEECRRLFELQLRSRWATRGAGVELVCGDEDATRAFALKVFR